MRIIPPISALPQTYGEYILHERLGVGGMAEVYRAERTTAPGRPVVIKRLRPKHAHDEDLARLFEAEARLTRSIRHPNIIEVYEYGAQPHGELFIAMEYVAGADLRRLLEHAARADRALPVWAGIRVVRQLLDALAFAHASTDEVGRSRNLVHCDVTPENVLVSRRGAVKLGDFGVASDDTRPTSPLADQAKGKLPYMSPEQVLEHRIDARSDLFSAAIVLWEALAGRRLFPGQTPSEIMAQICASPRPPPSRFAPNVSRELDDIVLNALDPDLETRFPTARAFAAALDDELSRIHAPTSMEALEREIISVLDAPVVRPDATLAHAADDGHDELEALDRRHEEKSALTGKIAPRVTLETDASTPRPTQVGRPDPRSVSKTRPRMEAVRPRAPSASTAADRARRRAAAPAGGADALLLAYLEDRDIGSGPTWSPPSSAPEPRRPSVPPATPMVVEAPRPSTSPAARTHSNPGFSNVLPSTAQAWLRDQGATRGPLGASTLLDLLATLTRRGRATEVEISLDRHSWMTASQLAVFLGEPMLEPVIEVPHVGDLSRQSFVHVVGRLGRARATGRLRVWTDNQDERTAFEIHLLNGAVTQVGWTAAAFEVWRGAFDDPSFENQGLPEALSAALATRCPLLTRLGAEATEKIGRQRHMLARRRFEAAVAWRQGHYVFSTLEPVHDGEHRQGVLQLLPGVVYTALGASELESRVQNRHEAHRFRVPLHEMGPDLGLTRGEVEALELFGQAETLATAVRVLGAQIDPKFVWAMAYLLTELELLRPVATP